MTFLKQFLWSVFVMFWFFYWIFVPKILLLEADHQASLRHGPSILGMSWGSHIQDEKVTTKNIFNLKKTFWRFGPFTPKFLDCLFWTFLVAPPFLVSKKGISRLIITVTDNCHPVTRSLLRSHWNFDDFRHGTVPKRRRSDGTVVSCSGPGSRASLPKRL